MTLCPRLLEAYLDHCDDLARRNILDHTLINLTLEGMTVEEAMREELRRADKVVPVMASDAALHPPSALAEVSIGGFTVLVHAQIAADLEAGGYIDRVVPPDPPLTGATD